MNCPICKSKQKKKKLVLFQETDKETRKKYSLFRCKNCGLIRPNPLPYTEETKNNVYNKSKQKGIRINFESQESKHYLKNFVPYIKFIKKYNINGLHLDIGCGGGSLLYLSRKIGLNPEGVELNRKLVVALRKKNYIIYDNALGNRLYNSKKYNLITANHVLEHIEDLHSFIKNVYQLLNDKGYFIIASPYIYGLIPRVLRTKWYGQGYGQHLNFFSIKSVKKLLASHGFKIVETKITSMDYTKFNMPNFIKKIINFVCNLLVKLNLGDNLFVAAKK